MMKLCQAAALGLVLLTGCPGVGDKNVVGRVQCTLSGVVDEGTPVGDLAIDAVGLFTDDEDLWRDLGGQAPRAAPTNPVVFFAAKPILMPSGALRDFYIALAPGDDGLAILYAEYVRESPQFIAANVERFEHTLVQNQVVDFECEEDEMSGDEVPIEGRRHGLDIYEGTFTASVSSAEGEQRSLTGCTLLIDPEETVQTAAETPEISCEN